MRDDLVAGWDGETEKLLCHVVLNDVFAKFLSSRAGDAYFRAFIVENRASGIVSMKFRFRYKEPDEASWFRVCEDRRGPEAAESLLDGITRILTMALTIALPGCPDEAVRPFYPPDDGGDPARTVIWLEMQDLVTISVAPLTPPNSR